MTTQPSQEPGSEEAAESPTQPGYGNDTGFAQEAEQDDEQVDSPDGSGDAPGDGA